MNKVLITGHRGSIGRVLNRRLLDRGYEVLGVDIKDGIDCADPSNLDAFKGVDTIFHLAAHIYPPKKNTIEACHGIAQFAKEQGARLVYASSAAVYNPDTLYAIHKLYGEQVFKNELKNVAILRLFNVYGGTGNGLIDRIDREEHIQVNGNGEQRRDYVHVKDVADAFIAAGEYKVFGTVDIGTGKSTSVNEVLQMSGHLDFEYVPRDGGVPSSTATKNYLFPWHHTRELEDYFL